MRKSARRKPSNFFHLSAAKSPKKISNPKKEEMSCVGTNGTPENMLPAGLLNGNVTHNA